MRFFFKNFFFLNCTVAVKKKEIQLKDSSNSSLGFEVGVLAGVLVSGFSGL
jgi:hypothetical protein